jgi:DNA-binding CsgD family transcriptional regulator
MEYLTVKETGEKWGLGTRIVTQYCVESRITGAVKQGNLWLIPANAQRPADKRRGKQCLPQRSLSSELYDIIAATAIPMPMQNPDAILDIVKEERLHIQYEGELAYLRGDFRKTILCFHKTEGDDAARLRACLAAIAAAISLGDYHTYMEIESYLKGYTEAYHGSDVAVFAELALATAAVSIIAPDMTPSWLREGDLSALPPQARPDALYIRAKYLQCIKNYEAMLAVAQTTLTLCSSEHGIMPQDIYLRVTCAVACHALNRRNEARHFLLDAMHIALPYGFITPFVEVITALGGLVESCLEDEFPIYYSIVIKQWKETWKNWITFHNQFTKDNITLILPLREYHIALLVTQHVPYAEIAKQYCISVGRLKNIMQEIYEKLYISGRGDLSKYIF